MPYTRAWDETQPPGTALAATLDTIIQNFKTDTRERVAGIFGLNLAQFTADPIVPISLTLSGALTAASLVGPLTGNVTGNLTGSVLTAAQGNITSLGTLTSLTVSGIITATAANHRFGNPSGTAGTKANQNILLYDVSANNWAGIQSDVNGNIALSTGIASRFTYLFDVAGNASFPGGLGATLITAAQPNITSLGTLTGLTISSAGGLTLSFIGAGTAAQYGRFLSTGGNVLFGVEQSTGGGVVVGAPAYSAFFGTDNARSLVLSTNSNARMTIDSAGNAVFTGTVTAANFVGPTSIDAGVLTGATLAANVVNSSLTSVGILTGLSISGRAIFGSGLSPTGVIQTLFGTSSVISSIGTAFSSGNLSSGYNVTQTGANGAGTDSWTQSNGALGSTLTQVSNVDWRLYVAPAGTGVGNFATFWGAAKAVIDSTGFVGNLTGTILTAAQANITSLGTLTTLLVNGTIASSATGVSTLILNRTEAAALRGYVLLRQGGSNQAGIGLDASNQFTIFDSTFALQRVIVATAGQFLVGTTSISGVAAGGIHAAGASVFDSTVLTGNLTSGAGGAGVFGLTNNGRAKFNPTTEQYAILLSRSEFGTGYFMGASSHATNPDLIFSNNAGTEKARLKDNGDWTMVGAITGVTSLTSTTFTGNLTGTILTAAQGNITSLGTLTSLSTGNITVGTNAASVGQLKLPNNNVVSWRNNANSSDFTLRLNTSDVFAFDSTVSASGFSGNVTGNITGNVTGTILTAAQGNITSLGTLTGLTVNGTITQSQATSKFLIGATTLTFRDSTDALSLLILDSSLGGTGGGTFPTVKATNFLDVNGTQVVSTRRTGWAAPTASLSRTAVAAADTLATTISHLAALVSDLEGHGLIGA